MSKFIKKQQYNSIDENIYDEFVDIDSITIEEIDKEIEDFYIDKEKINNIKFEFDKNLIIKEAIDKAEEDIKKEKNKKIISKLAACIALLLSIGIYNPALAYNIPPIMNVLENINNLLHVDEIASYIGVDKIIPRAVVDIGIYNPALAYNIPPIMNVLENINNLLHVDEIASYIGVDKIIPRAVVDNENKVKFVKPTKYKVENDNTEIVGLGNELEHSQKVLEISEINTQYGVVDFIHRMSNKIIKPIDGRKNGSIDINPKTIDIALNSLKNIGDEKARDYLHYELSKWKNGDFENAVLVHNYVWHMLDGNIGKALSLDTYEVNKIKSKYFK